MITLTPRAAQYLIGLLASAGVKAPPGAIRLEVVSDGKQGWKYTYKILRNTETEAKRSEFLLICRGARIIVDPLSMRKMRGTKIGLSRKLSSLIFHNPQADILCGFDRSFQLKEKKSPKK